MRCGIGGAGPRARLARPVLELVRAVRKFLVMDGDLIALLFEEQPQQRSGRVSLELLSRLHASDPVPEHLAVVRFEWDPTKERRNLTKHGISFKEARALFTSGVD